MHIIWGLLIYLGILADYLFASWYNCCRFRRPDLSPIGIIYIYIDGVREIGIGGLPVFLN